MVIFIKIIGFLISVLPVSVLERITNFLGLLLVTIPNKRKRIIFSNLKYAFPEWDKKKIYCKGRESAVRLIEMGFLSLSYSFFSGFRKRSLLLMDQYTEDCLSDLRKSGEAVIFLIPHVCLFETLAISPFFRPFGGKRLGAIYRPNRNPELDQFIIEARSTAGVKVFARDSALWGARDFLKRGNWLGLLFDQHSGIQGCHSYFLNRFASITTMPELLAKTSGARVVFSFPRRVSFFKAKLQLEELTCEATDYPFKAHEILEHIIRDSDGLPEWLWAHERWKTQQNYRFHLRHRHKREKIPCSEIRTTKIWIRIPNWLGDVVMTFPLIDAIRRGRPDAEITLIGKPQFKELLQNLKVGDKFIDLPYGSGIKAVVRFLNNRTEYCSLIINLSNSLRSDLECFLLNIPHRYGLTFKGRWRPLLTQVYSSEVSPELGIHQVHLWEGMLNHFGLREKLNFTPHNLQLNQIKNKIGIFPGSSNQPLKRWPLDNWKKLISKLLENDSSIEIHIYGTANERKKINSCIGAFCGSRVINKCGRTNIWELAKELVSCVKVIGNDSGGMHLANFLGVECIILFGPTNPRITAPIFESKMQIIKPKKIDGQLSHDLNDLTIDEVFNTF